MNIFDSDFAITDEQHITAIYKSLSMLYLESFGYEGGSQRPQLYPFPPHHVKSIHTRGSSGTAGIWFHLVDGSIWDANASIQYEDGQE
ncbi:MAG: hypothetical protein AAFZ92_10105 [Pseudomonadota bacterium]